MNGAACVCVCVCVCVFSLIHSAGLNLSVIRSFSSHTHELSAQCFCTYRFISSADLQTVESKEGVCLLHHDLYVELSPGFCSPLM